MIEDIQSFVYDLERNGRADLADIERHAAAIDALLQHADAIAEEILASVPTVPANRRPTEDEKHRASSVRLDVAILDGTASSAEAIVNARLQAWVAANHPTRRDLREWREVLQRTHERETARLARWSGHETRPYTYVGPKFKHHKADGTCVMPGEIVELTEGQARSFADRFTAV